MGRSLALVQICIDILKIKKKIDILNFQSVSQISGVIKESIIKYNENCCACFGNHRRFGGLAYRLFVYGLLRSIASAGEAGAGRGLKLLITFLMNKAYQSANGPGGFFHILGLLYFLTKARRG